MVREQALHWVTRSQTLPRASMGALVLAGALALYCFLHGLLSGEPASLLASPAWGLALALPWCGAWEALKRLPPLPASLPQAIAALAAALTADVALETGLAWLAFGAVRRSAAELAYARVPLALLAGAGWLLLRPRAHPWPRVVLNVPTRNGPLSLEARDIDYVQAAGNYVEIMSAGRSLLLRRTLRELESGLAAEGFIRVHRRLLVNSARVVGVLCDSRRLPCLRLACGAQLPVGRRYRRALERLEAAKPANRA